MCKEIKRLTSLSECPHLNKTDRDAVTWAIYQIQPPEVEPEKGFDGFDFSSWPCLPDKSLFNDVIKARKAKHGAIMNQAWIDSAAPHLHFLNDKSVDVHTSMTYCAKNGWQGFGAKWVLNEIDKDKENMPLDELIIQNSNTPEAWIKRVDLKQVTSRNQMPKEVRLMIDSMYRLGKYKPETMKALEDIGFAV